MNKETKNEKSTNKMSVIKRWIIILIILFIGAFTLACATATARPNLPTSIHQEKIELIDSSIDTFILPHDSIRNEMIDEVRNYLTKSTRGKADPNLPQYLVDNALKYNIDLCFVMSQTKIETCFGTAGAGRPSSRRSLFGVIKRKYSSYDEAIEDYCKLLKKYYLVKGRTEFDLMKRYVTGSGSRYAGNPNYERELSAEYKKIAKLTNLTNLQKSYNAELLAYENKLKESKDSTAINEISTS